MLLLHHSFVDGVNISSFLNCLNEQGALRDGATAMVRKFIQGWGEAQL